MLTRAAADRLLAAIPHAHRAERLALWLMLASGLRPQTVLALRWRDLALATQPSLPIGTRRLRLVDPALVAALRAYAAHLGALDHALIFPDPHTGRPLAVAALHRTFTTACRQLAVDWSLRTWRDAWSPTQTRRRGLPRSDAQAA